MHVRTRPKRMRCASIANNHIIYCYQDELPNPYPLACKSNACSLCDKTKKWKYANKTLNICNIDCRCSLNKLKTLHKFADCSSHCSSSWLRGPLWLALPQSIQKHSWLLCKDGYFVSEESNQHRQQFQHNSSLLGLQLIPSASQEFEALRGISRLRLHRWPPKGVQRAMSENPPCCTILLINCEPSPRLINSTHKFPAGPQSSDSRRPRDPQQGPYCIKRDMNSGNVSIAKSVSGDMCAAWLMPGYQIRFVKLQPC